MLAGLCALGLLGLTATTLAQAVKNPDTLVIVRISSPESLDPAWADDIYSREPIAYMVYEPLIFFDGGSTSRYVPMLATNVPRVPGSRAHKIDAGHGSGHKVGTTPCSAAKSI